MQWYHIGGTTAVNIKEDKHNMQKLLYFSFTVFAVSSQRNQAMLVDSQWVSPVRHGIVEPSVFPSTSQD